MISLDPHQKEVLQHLQTFTKCAMYLDMGL